MMHEVDRSPYVRSYVRLIVRTYRTVLYVRSARGHFLSLSVRVSTATPRSCCNNRALLRHV
jgi:hypothetical protein